METEKVTEAAPADEDLVAALLVPAEDQTEEAAIAALAEQHTEVAEDSARPDSERDLLLLEELGTCLYGE